MSSRYSEIKNEVRFRLSGEQRTFPLEPRFNIAPTQLAAVLIQTGDRAELERMDWGWKAKWGGSPVINVKAEALVKTFNVSLSQRCLVPADGFYEWMPDKTPMRFVRADAGEFCFAGLWNMQNSGRSFVIVTTSAFVGAHPMQDRMPLVVRPVDYDRWLSGDEFQQVLDQPDATQFNAYAVSRELTDVRNDHAGLILPAGSNAD